MWSRATETATRLAKSFDELAPKSWFRTAVAIGFAVMHLILFAQAGHARLGVPFNSHPDEAPYFSNPNAPATRIFPRQPHNWSRLVVSRWDSQHYIGTAVRGLSACPKDPDTAPNVAYLDCGLGWLPAYGAIGYTVASVTGLAEDVSIELVSLICAVIVNLLWTHKAFTERIGRRESYLALLAFNLFPTAFYMVTPYTEAMTLALCLGAYIMITKDRWVMAGLMVGASTALRISSVAFGVALGCTALVAAWRKRRDKEKRWWWPLLSIPLVGWGQLVEMLAIKAIVNTAYGFWRARKAFGDKHDLDRFVQPTWFLKGLGAQHMDIVIYGAIVGILAMFGREVIKKFKPEEAIYLGVATLMTMILVVLAPLEYWGMNRYMLMCPLAFVAMAFMAKRHTLLFVLWLVFCIAFYWHIEMCSYVAQGNPEICPCLGRFEFAMPMQ
jgi:hypothetical protein|nr:hypothetical protein [Kofleriaceae bacterium]